MASSKSVAQQKLPMVMGLNTLTMPSYLSIIAEYPEAYSAAAAAHMTITAVSGHNHGARFEPARRSFT